MSIATAFLSALGTSLTASMIPAAAKAGDASGGDGGALAGLMSCCGTFFILIAVVMVVQVLIGWKIFTKAGQPGWITLVPVYNQWILITQVCKLEPMWFFIALVPVGNIISAWKTCMELAKAFGKTEGFGWGLFLLTPIFAAMLAFGDAKYRYGKRRRDDDDDDEDEDEEDEEDEDDRPKKKKKPARDEDEDEEEDEKPKKKKPSRDDDEDEDERPKKKKPRRDDDD